MNNQQTIRAIALTVVNDLKFPITDKMIIDAIDKHYILSRPLGIDTQEINASVLTIRDEILKIIEHELFTDETVEQLTRTLARRQIDLLSEADMDSLERQLTPTPPELASH